MPYNLISATIAETPTITLDTGPYESIGKTLGDMQDEIMARVGKRGDLDVDRITGFINDAYIDLASSLVLPELRATISFDLVVDSYVYQLPREVRLIEGGSITSVTNGERPLVMIDLPLYRKLRDMTDLTTRYFRTGPNLLVVWATPSTVESVVFDVAIRPTKMSAAEHSPILPEEFHEQIQTMAEAKALSAIGDKDAGASALNEVVSGMRRKVDTEAEEKTHTVAAFRSARHMRNVNRLDQNDHRRGEW